MEQDVLKILRSDQNVILPTASEFGLETFYYPVFLFHFCYLIELQMGFLPGESGTTIRHNTKIHITQNITPHSNKTHYKTTLTINNTLHSMNTTQKK
jgi:hypothetical protein